MAKAGYGLSHAATRLIVTVFSAFQLFLAQAASARACNQKAAGDMDDTWEPRPERNVFMQKSFTITHNALPPIVFLEAFRVRRKM